MFAVDGGFLSALEKIARSTPIIPLIGDGRTRLQPVHASDVAEAVYLSLRYPDARGKCMNSEARWSYTIREIFGMVLADMGRSPRFISIPFALASPLARVLELLPGAPLTVAQVDLLRSDNIPAAGIEELGILSQTLQDTISQLARPSDR